MNLYPESIIECMDDPACCFFSWAADQSYSEGPQFARKPQGRWRLRPPQSSFRPGQGGGVAGVARTQRDLGRGLGVSFSS